MKKIFNKFLLCLFLLIGNYSLLIPASFGATNSEEIEFEAIKAPPRDIKDILGILEQTKQDLRLIEKAKAVLAIAEPKTDDKEILNSYFYRRAVAEESLENNNAAYADYKRIFTEFPSSQVDLRIEERSSFAVAAMSRGDHITAIKVLEETWNQVPQFMRGWKLSIDRNIARSCLALGDLDCAKKSSDRLESEIKDLLSRGKPSSYLYPLNWRQNSEWTRSQIQLFQGKYIEAERSLRKAIALNQEILNATLNAGQSALDNEKRILQDGGNSSKNSYQVRINLMIDLSKAYMGQRRLIDAEYWAREAVLTSIKQFGVNAARTSSALLTLTRVVLEQGRQAEAVLLGNAALKIAQQSTDYPAAAPLAEARKVLASALGSDAKFAQADKVFTEMMDAIKSDPEMAARYKSQDINWSLALIKIGKADQALTMTSYLLAEDEKRFDENSAGLALTRAFNASALQASGQSAPALINFKKSIPILVDQSRNDSENNTQSVRQAQRINFVLEEYLAALAQVYKTDPSTATVAEAFQIADLARGSGVQKALTASAARANIKDPQLASLARREQDLQQRISTLTELLIGLLSAPPAQQLPVVQTKIREDIVTFKAQREQLKKEISNKFPDYAELIDPKPASVERTQQFLKSDEVLISWYFGDRASYVWAITKNKPAQFVQLALGRTQMAKEVAKLRASLDPGVATIDEIPAFDVGLSNQLYQQILAPVENAFKDKKIMLTVPHAELGQLPLSLLVTKSTEPPSKTASVAFLGYKSVPWLTREIAISQVPSVTALTSLRSAPPSSTERRNFIGFGDPYFSSQQEKAAERQAKASMLATRGVPLNLRSAPKTTGVSSAELALLPRLADTSAELQEVGKAIGAEDGDIYLHQQASVNKVMTTDMSRTKVVMFATHGLVPGELNGLTQPALALSSPEVTGDKDDGLLTMDKVMTLKLDADWVVLSACNTASGEGAGSEAVSGLGRAFFYAGAKALLVSNWPVDSVASRAMMTDLFRNQQRVGVTSKGELLRQAMLNQIDNGGVKEGGKMRYSYAHPLFWAPFVVVGD